MVYSNEEYMRKIDSIKRAQKNYYERNKAKILARQKIYDSEHKEQIKERIRKKRAIIPITDN
jgi:lipase chaperone LimK